LRANSMTPDASSISCCAVAGICPARDS